MGVLDVTISEVFHVLPEDRELVLRLGFAISFQGNNRLFSPGYLFLDGWFPGAILLSITFENIVYPRHVAIGCAGGEEREHVGDGDAHGWLLLVFVIGLLEWVNGCYRREAFALSTII